MTATPTAVKTGETNRIEKMRENARVHIEGEQLVLELRAYRQRDGTVQVRWLSNGIRAKDEGTDTALIAEAYQAIAKDAIAGAVLWARLDGRGQVEA